MKKRIVRQQPKLGGGRKGAKVFDKKRISLELRGIKCVFGKNVAG